MALAATVAEMVSLSSETFVIVGLDTWVSVDPSTVKSLMLAASSSVHLYETSEVPSSAIPVLVAIPAFSAVKEMVTSSPD